MLVIEIPKRDFWDEEKEEFVYSEPFTLELEHSLVSLAKWEAIWEKPFLGPKEKTTEEIVGYINCMTVSPNVPPEIYQRLTDENLTAVNQYINAKMTATTFNRPDGPKKTNNSIITAEIVYYWMISLQIPIEFEHWHLSRLFTLIEVCNEKNAPPKKQSRRDMVSERKRINAQRRAAQGHTG